MTTTRAERDITRRVDATDVQVRSIARRTARCADDLAVRDLFDSTLLLGHAVGCVPARFEDYRELCVGWYLDDGRDDAAVAVVDGAAAGYALVCTDERAASRWAVRRSVRLAALVAGDGVRRRLDPASRRFYRGRLRDAFELAGTRRRPPAPVHAHVNVAPGRRAGSVTVALLRHIDERCRRAGSAAWYGEINERAGARSAALRRLGLDVVGTDTNHTMSRLLGERVQRLTVVRTVPNG